MPFQELRDALGILAMPLHAQRQRLQTLQEQPGIEGGCSGTDVSQQLYASLDNICQDRKSTRLNSSHQIISYAVFCLKKKTKLQPLNKLLHTLCNHVDII